MMLRAKLHHWPETRLVREKLLLLEKLETPAVVLFVCKQGHSIGSCHKCIQSAKRNMFFQHFFRQTGDLTGLAKGEVADLLTSLNVSDCFQQLLCPSPGSPSRRLAVRCSAAERCCVALQAPRGGPA